MPEFNETQKKQIEEIALEVVKKYNQSSAFTDRKITDTPTDALSVVNRKFVTLNGVISSRPVSSVAVTGQHYFATDTSILMIKSPAGWLDTTGSVIAQNN